MSLPLVSVCDSNLFSKSIKLVGHHLVEAFDDEELRLTNRFANNGPRGDRLSKAFFFCST